MPFLLSFLLGHLRTILLVVVIAGAAFAVVAMKHGYDEGKRDEGRTEVRTKELKPLQDQVEAARQRATALALQWDAQRKAADAAVTERDNERTARFEESKQRLAIIAPAVAAAPVPESVARVFDSAIAAANHPAETPGPASEAAPAAARPAETAPNGFVTMGALAAWGQQVAELYDECRDRVTAWQSFYRSLQAAQ